MLCKQTALNPSPIIGVQRVRLGRRIDVGSRGHSRIPVIPSLTRRRCRPTQLSFLHKAHSCDRHHIASAMAELVSSCRSSRICGRSTFLRNSAPLNAGLFLRRSTQRGHAIGIVFGLLLLEAFDDAGKLLVVKGQIGPPALAHDPSSSNFPASHLGSELGLIAQSYRAFSSPPFSRLTRLPRQGDLLPLSVHAFAGVVRTFREQKRQTQDKTEALPPMRH
jgi:hypothetical protein